MISVIKKWQKCRNFNVSQSIFRGKKQHEINKKQDSDVTHTVNKCVVIVIFKVNLRKVGPLTKVQTNPNIC